MATIRLPPDFKEFLKLLNSSNVEYLVIDGYAVNYYGFARATADLGIRIATDRNNAAKVAGRFKDSSIWNRRAVGQRTAGAGAYCPLGRGPKLANR